MTKLGAMEVEGHTRATNGYPTIRTGLIRFAVGLCLVTLCAFALFSERATGFAASTQVAASASSHSLKSGTDPKGLPATASPVGNRSTGGWESPALHDLADLLGWSPVVQIGDDGRLSVQQVITASEWSQAVIRPFDYSAGAEAAFAAEQEDARVAGLDINSEAFGTYPAYWAVLTDQEGIPVERRFHWLAGSWVLGVDVHGTSAEQQAIDPQAIAQQLVAFAVQYGMPPPDGGLSPTATSGQAPPVTPSSTPCGIVFSDVPPDMWAYNYISRLACIGIVSGYADGTFRPQRGTTRAQLAKMIVLSEGWDLVSPQSPSFGDVGPDHAFFTFVETARARGIVSGYVNGNFRPDALVTRAQVAKMLVGARRWSLRIISPVSLCDVPSTYWASSYIQIAIAHGVFTGYGDGCFRPDDPATRAQLAKLLALAYR